MSEKLDIQFLIIGAGPTGLGAATRCHEKGHEWLLLEAGPGFGGLASSFVDEQGFTWDMGGHVQFSHYDTFDRYMNHALGADGWYQHQRESWVWIKGRFVPYPFQNNLHRLDARDRWACVEGLLEAWQRACKQEAGKEETGQGAPLKNFEDWMLATFGPGITECFMYPYNFKVWAYPPSEMDYHWIGERVSVPGLGGVLKSICTGQDEVAWGPNKMFRFPKAGGTGAVWKAIGEELPPDRVHLECPVNQIDPVARKVITADGREWTYRSLISTVPLNHLIHMAPGVVPPEASDELRYSATNVVGIGINGKTPEHLKTKCWMYFPDSNSPYYRVTVFTNYSPANAPRPGEQWSLMTETAESPMKPVRQDSLVEETLLALEEDGLLPDRDAVCSVVHRRLPQGYPTPFLGRDKVVDPLLRAFEAVNIYSRGRFGAWKYEVANQDHSFAQGYECVDRVAAEGGSEMEPTLHTPDLVNARRNP